jgi:hypothetical protein
MIATTSDCTTIRTDHSCNCSIRMDLTRRYVTLLAKFLWREWKYMQFKWKIFTRFCLVLSQISELTEKVVTIGFWRWCTTFRNIEFSDYIHRPGIKNTNQGKHDVSETASVSVLRCGKNPILLGPLERASPNHWTFRTISIVLVLKKQTKGNKTFRKLDLFPSSGAGKILFCWVP